MKYIPVTAVVVLWASLCLNIVSSSLAPEKQPSHQGGPPEVVEADITGIVHVHPENIVQNFHTVCHEEESSKYRTADGSCNNAFNLGSANTPLRRMLPAQYDDSKGAPRTRGKSGEELPVPTDVSRLLHDDNNAFADRTLMFMQFGQFLDHDLGLAPVPVSELGAVHCCDKHGDFANASADRDCMPIPVKDHRFHGKCMDFSRSIPAFGKAHGTLKVPRQQLNDVTSFVDGSMIYGSSEELLERLRDKQSRALLKIGENGLLPRAEHGECLPRPGDYCFLAGDARVNEQPGLIVIHTLWVRLHNRIAENLQNVRPYDDPEHIFRLSRRIVVAILQNILYEEWLPLVLGRAVMRDYGLLPGRRVAYSSSTDPSIINAFTTAAFRFGHSLIPREYNVSGKIFPLRKIFHRPDIVFDDFYGMLKALADPLSEEMESQQIDAHVVDEVTAHLFEPTDQKPDAPSRGLDLVALNIQRGRDHGLPPFNAFRKACGLPPFESFDDFGPVVKEKLQSLYSSVDDIDLFTGGLVEPTETPGLVGPTFACIIGEQFHALKYGDRFYFETVRQLEGFNNNQLKAIRKVTMSQVLCFFPDDEEFKDKKAHVIRRIQKHAFLIPSKKNTLRPCARLRRKFLNFDLWA